MINGQENGLLKKYNDTLQANKKYKRPNRFGATSFIVAHYAGDVEYEVANFLEKNRDTVRDVIVDTLSKSNSELISSLFFKEPEQQ